MSVLTCMFVLEFSANQRGVKLVVFLFSHLFGITQGHVLCQGFLKKVHSHQKRVSLTADVKSGQMCGLWELLPRHCGLHGAPLNCVGIPSLLYFRMCGARLSNFSPK